MRKGGPVLNGYMTVQETAGKWGVTSRQVQVLCKGNRISGATKLSRIWIIPDTAEKPTTDILHEVDDAVRKIDLSGAPWTMHEFFAGSGLVAYGLKGMFSPVWSNDVSERKAAVYHANFLSDHFSLGDIKNISGDSLPHAHLSWASFPCQDLSLAGNQKGIFAERSGLVWEWLRVFDELKEKPKIVALENVAGLLSSNNGENYKSLHSAMIQRGYKCGAICLNASAFVPQSRPRVFVIAVKKDVQIPDSMIGDGPCWLHNTAAIKLGRELNDWVWWKAKKPAKRTSSITDVLDPKAAYDKDDVLRLVPEKGMKKLNSHTRMIATGYRRTRNGSQRLELRFDGVAGCLRTPGGGSSKQYVVVRENGHNHARLLTTREAARLMGAPDSFMLPGTYNDGYYAMGDAVALPVAKFIGETILLPLAEAAYHGQETYQ